MFNELAKEWYDTSHLPAYYQIWDTIQKSSDQDKLIEYYYNLLASRKFDKQVLGEEYTKSRAKQIEYLRKRLYIDAEFIDSRFQTVENSADVRYYEQVREELPKLVQVALNSVLGRMKGHLNWDNYEDIVLETTQKLKRLMVFAWIREDRGIVETVVHATVYEKMQDWRKNLAHQLAESMQFILLLSCTC